MSFQGKPGCYDLRASLVPSVLLLRPVPKLSHLVPAEPRALSHMALCCQVSLSFHQNKCCLPSCSQLDLYLLSASHLEFRLYVCLSKSFSPLRPATSPHPREMTPSLHPLHSWEPDREVGLSYSLVTGGEELDYTAGPFRILPQVCPSKIVI